jgi:hypothetical protein
VTVVTQGFDDNVEWEPFVDGILVGYKCTRVSDGAVTRVYLNPSTSGRGAPDVFVYMGCGNPANDGTVCFFTPEFT